MTLSSGTTSGTISSSGACWEALSTCRLRGRAASAASANYEGDGDESSLGCRETELLLVEPQQLRQERRNATLYLSRANPEINLLLTGTIEQSRQRRRRRRQAINLPAAAGNGEPTLPSSAPPVGPEERQSRKPPGGVKLYWQTTSISKSELKLGADAKKGLRTTSTTIGTRHKFRHRSESSRWCVALPSGCLFALLIGLLLAQQRSQFNLVESLLFEGNNNFPSVKSNELEIDTEVGLEPTKLQHHQTSVVLEEPFQRQIISKRSTLGDILSKLTSPIFQSHKTPTTSTTSPSPIKTITTTTAPASTTTPTAPRAEVATTKTTTTQETATSESPVAAEEEDDAGAGDDDGDTEGCQGLSVGGATEGAPLTDNARLVNLQACIQAKVKQRLLGATRSGLELFEKLTLTGGCTANLVNLASSFAELKSFAFKFADASAKVPSGVINGLLSDYGDFDQCLSIRSDPELGPDVEYEAGAYSGKYCLLSVKLDFHVHLGPNETVPEGIYPDGILWDSLVRRYWTSNSSKGFQLGVCIPSRCTSDDLEQIFKHVAESYNVLGSVVSCQDGGDLQRQHTPDTTQQVIGFIFALLIGLNVLCSLIDRYLVRAHYSVSPNNRPMEEVANEGRNSYLLSAAPSGEESIYQTTARELELIRRNFDERDEPKPMLSLLVKLITCFSLTRNWRTFTRIDSTRVLTAQPCAANRTKTTTTGTGGGGGGGGILAPSRPALNLGAQRRRCDTAGYPYFGSIQYIDSPQWSRADQMSEQTTESSLIIGCHSHTESAPASSTSSQLEGHTMESKLNLNPDLVRFATSKAHNNHQHTHHHQQQQQQQKQSPCPPEFEVRFRRSEKDEVEEGVPSNHHNNDHKGIDNARYQSLSHLSGLRLLVIVWITVGHSFLYPSANNYQYYRAIVQMNVTRHSIWFATTNFTLAIDTLLYMTGLAFAYKLGKQTTGGRCANGRQSAHSIGGCLLVVLKLIARRCLRFWPTYLTVIALAILVPLASDGPLWPEMVSHRLGATCRSNWWANLLMVNNWFYSESEICLPSSWFISVIMQLFFLGSLIILIMHRYSVRLALTLLMLALVCSSGASYYVAHKFKIRAPAIKMDESFVMDMDDNIFKLYTNLFNNMGPFLIGMLGGLLLLRREARLLSLKSNNQRNSQTKTSRFADNQDYNSNHHRYHQLTPLAPAPKCQTTAINCDDDDNDNENENQDNRGICTAKGRAKVILACQWMGKLIHSLLMALIVIVMAALVLSSVFHEHYTPFYASLYWALHRTCWAIVAGYVIHQCAIGRWRLLHDILSLSTLIPLSRLIFIAYLVYPIFIYMHSGSVRDGLHVSMYNMMNIYITRLVLTFSAALAIHLLVELPFCSLETVLLNWWRRRQKRVAHQSKNQFILPDDHLMRGEDFIGGDKFSHFLLSHENAARFAPTTEEGEEQSHHHDEEEENQNATDDNDDNSPTTSTTKANLLCCKDDDNCKQEATTRK